MDFFKKAAKNAFGLLGAILAIIGFYVVIPGAIITSVRDGKPILALIVGAFGVFGLYALSKIDRLDSGLPAELKVLQVIFFGMAFWGAGVVFLLGVDWF